MVYVQNDFPTSIQDPVIPTANDEVSDFDHAGLEEFQNESIKALKDKVGANSSAVTTSHDYKLSEVTSSDKAVGITATQTLTNKTLTAPKIVNGGFIADNNGNEQIEFETTASAVNHINVKNGATGSPAIINAKGSDTNISLRLNPKGTGSIEIGTANLKFPNADGTANQVIRTDGAGNLSFGSAGTPSAETSIPKPVIGFTGTSNVGRSTATEMIFGLIDVPQDITVNKVTVWIGGYTSSGTYRIGVYTRDGQTRLINFLTATISSGSQRVTTTLGAPVALSAGQYYVCGVPTGGNFELMSWDTNTGVYTNLNQTTGEQFYQGKKTVSSGVLPTTFDPTSIVSTDRFDTLAVRLDN